MKTVTIEFPVLSWGSAEMRVDDDCDLNELLHDILSGDVDVQWDGKFSSSVPMYHVGDATREFCDNNEIPYELEIVE